MPFGLTNAPAVFQNLVNDVLKDMFNRFVFIYLDYILIFSRSLHEHEQHPSQQFVVELDTLDTGVTHRQHMSMFSMFRISICMSSYMNIISLNESSELKFQKENN